MRIDNDGVLIELKDFAVLDHVQFDDLWRLLGVMYRPLANYPSINASAALRLDYDKATLMRHLNDGHDGMIDDCEQCQPMTISDSTT